MKKIKAHDYSKSFCMCCNLKNRKQKVTRNGKENKSKEIIAGIRQGSSDGPLFYFFH